jgi:tetratricopeptide (TPR) repeat protein
MNTKIYKTVHDLSVKLLNAAETENDVDFDTLFDELKEICYSNQNDEVKNHPVQWETLGDFTEDMEEAIEHYELALKYATQINDKDYTSSINYSMAILFQEMGDNAKALTAALEAKKQANKIPDKELKEEIEELIKELS